MQIDMASFDNKTYFYYKFITSIYEILDKKIIKILPYYSQISYTGIYIPNFTLKINNCTTQINLFIYLLSQLIN